MRKLLLSALAIIAVCSASAQKGSTDKVNPAVPNSALAKTILKNDLDSFSYSLGLSIGESLKQSGITKVNQQLLAKAMNEIFTNSKTMCTKEQANSILQQKLQAFTKKKGEAQKQEGKDFLAANKKRSGITELPNGLQYEVLKAGEANGAKPKVTDTVVVNYVGTLTNGKEFDNSIKRGAPATFPLNGVIRGWTEILQLMPKGAS